MARPHSYLASLGRGKKIAIQIAGDCVLMTVCFVAAMLFRLENLDFLDNPKIWLPLLITIPVTVITFHTAGLYRTLVRYITGRILISVFKGVLVSAVTLYCASVLLKSGVPRSVPLIYLALLFLAIGGLRFVIRHFFRQPSQVLRKPVIIYGAGEAGLMLMNSLYHGREYDPVGFVDDNPDLHGMTKGGLKVYSPETIQKLIDERRARVILLAVPSISRRRRRDIVERLENTKLEIKTIPGMTDIISGRAKISELRTVTPEDLLGRDPVAPISTLMEKNTTGKVVMISGAGGSIGSELCRQILYLNPRSLVLFETSEYALYRIEAELKDLAQRTCIPVEIVPILGSVQHPKRLKAAIAAYEVQTIYHAAAYKHVPLVEENVIEGIRNNVFGTLEIATAAKRQGVESFILISTDKAVRPTNVMGATKRIAELVCQALASEPSDTVFSMVRFGNVLGSSGSVIPLFRSQIESGGPLTVTHRDVTRYFMTIPEAAQLVIQAGAMAKGGDVFVLDMGQPVKIMDLAISMVRLHGLQPYFVDGAAHSQGAKEPPRTDGESGELEQGDIPICVTGLRKGEKLYEELLVGNNPAPTQHPRIMTASETSLTMVQLMPVLERLLAACKAQDIQTIRRIFNDLPLEYSPSNPHLADLIWNKSPQTVLAAPQLVK